MRSSLAPGVRGCLLAAHPLCLEVRRRPFRLVDRWDRADRLTGRGEVRCSRSSFVGPFQTTQSDRTPGFPGQPE